MTNIHVKAINGTTFQVTVTAKSTTNHEVNVDPAYAKN